ncbi:MAG: hypothetical protein MSA54_01510 [Campylobacter sp.]|uniref:hypothetical protein n=1 Tax=Campylobacter sp. TaxID=205 RepID=UPI002A74B793|nr:hypothetical protein [Campylobacter sp.]MCI7500615.1 hypothetical protein [Campylobacter sp.]
MFYFAYYLLYRDKDTSNSSSKSPACMYIFFITYISIKKSNSTANNKNIQSKKCCSIIFYNNRLFIVISHF